MALYTPESLDQLRRKVDLIEVISSHLPLKRAGATYKCLCPFHEEKTPSFVLQSGDDHYHCFGCGAHGDAIAFLMNYSKMSFVEAVESLAERFGVILEKTNVEEKKRGPDRIVSKEALDLACRFYHTLLLHTDEGHKALHYLYQRGIDLEFIKFFRIGYALSEKNTFYTFAKKEKVPEEILLSTGLINEKKRDFFSERILFPITDPFGSVIGFSGRKFKEKTFGGKYINTPETPLFKKSKTLFGLSYCRNRIAKEKRAIIVEGQIDTLRLIYAGIDFVVAAQGTAFGEGHVKVLSNLGVNQVYLAMDGDEAGKKAALKIGNLFQKEGIGVSVISLPQGSDPDSFVQKEGIDRFLEHLEIAEDYLTFLVKTSSEGVDMVNPAQKNHLLQELTNQIRSWNEPVMVHESLKKVAVLTKVPETLLGVGAPPAPTFIQRLGKAGKEQIDPDQILEADLLRWLIVAKEDGLFEIVKKNLSPTHLKHPICKRIYEHFLTQNGPRDLISLGSILEKEDEQILLSEIVKKKVNPKKSEEGVIEVVRRLLTRKWMEEREAIRNQIQSGSCTDEELLRLAKAFDEVKKNPPEVILP